MSIQVSQNTFIDQINETKNLCQLLMQQPHYAKMGADGIFAVVETSKSLGIDPRQALNGGLYFVKGKVEMSARMMNQMIRSKGHSITKDPKSDERICILHGKRADNGDTWTESFSWEEAQRSGLTNNPVWKNYTRDMLFARALSRLARQLYPDVIGNNTYVEGEISLDQSIPDISPKLSHSVPVEKEAVVVETINEAEFEYLAQLFEGNEEERKKMLKVCPDLIKMPRAMFTKVAAKLEKINAEKKTMEEQYIADAVMEAEAVLDEV